MPSDMDRGGLDGVLGFHLSDSQWEAVSAPLAPGVIVAGAGTGKTTSMSARVAYLSAIGAVDPDRVLGPDLHEQGCVRPRCGHPVTRRLRRLCRGGAFGLHLQRVRLGGWVTDYGLRIGHEPKATLLTDGLRYQHAYRMVCSLSMATRWVRVWLVWVAARWMPPISCSASIVS